MGKLNKTCLVCQTPYRYCYTCPTDLQNPSWKNLFDTEQCKEIFNILSKNGQGIITDDEAKELLDNCDLSQKDAFAVNIKTHINNLYGYDTVEEEIQEEIKAYDELTDETEDSSVVSNIEEKVETDKTIFPKKMTYNKKRRKK